MKNALVALWPYLFWGMVPFYWAHLKEVPVAQMLIYRAGVALLVCLMLHPKQFTLKSHQKNFNGYLILSSLCILANWGIYVFAMTKGYVVEGSFAYFINPFINMFLGWWWFHERPTHVQGAAIILALVGVLLLLQTPIYSWTTVLGLSISFGLYAALKRKAGTGVVYGMGTEFMITLPLIILYGFIHPYEWYQFASIGKLSYALASGFITLIPLLGLSYAIKRVTMMNIGMCQFVTPVCHFIIGTVYFGRPWGFYTWPLLFIGSAVLLYVSTLAKKSSTTPKV